MVAIEALVSTGVGVGAGVGVVAAATEGAALGVVVAVLVVPLSHAPTSSAAANTPADNETLTKFFFITVAFSLMSSAVISQRSQSGLVDDAEITARAVRLIRRSFVQPLCHRAA
jgi:hypothetical protein